MTQLRFYFLLLQTRLGQGIVLLLALFYATVAYNSKPLHYADDHWYLHAPRDAFSIDIEFHERTVCEQMKTQVAEASCVRGRTLNRGPAAM